jgi:hypothetical protein
MDNPNSTHHLHCELGIILNKTLSPVSYGSSCVRNTHIIDIFHIGFGFFLVFPEC